MLCAVAIVTKTIRIWKELSATKLGPSPLLWKPLNLTEMTLRIKYTFEKWCFWEKDVWQRWSSCNSFCPLGGGPCPLCWEPLIYRTAGKEPCNLRSLNRRLTLITSCAFVSDILLCRYADAVAFTSLDTSFLEVFFFLSPETPKSIPKMFPERPVQVVNKLLLLCKDSDEWDVFVTTVAFHREIQSQKKKSCLKKQTKQKHTQSFNNTSVYLLLILQCVLSIGM